MNKNVVVKISGQIASDSKLLDNVLSDTVKLFNEGLSLGIVHGMGVDINSRLAKLGVQKPLFVNGLRYTDEKTLQVVMDSSKEIKKKIMDALIAKMSQSDDAVDIDGLSLFTSQYLDENTYGKVGKVIETNSRALKSLWKKHKLLVASPICKTKQGEPLNVNADWVAGAYASCVGAEVVFISSSGVLDKNGELISELSVTDIKKLIEQGIVTDGMALKLETCKQLIEQGVPQVAIIGSAKGDLYLEKMTTQGSGTIIAKDF